MTTGRQRVDGIGGIRRIGRPIFVIETVADDPDASVCDGSENVVDAGPCAI
jgi:hypothetical protein